MRAKSKQVPGDLGTERVVVLQVLDGERSRTELERELHDIDREAISGALSSLEALGVVIVEGEQVRASPCAQRLDALGLITV